jgi:hypothetical protein
MPLSSIFLMSVASYSGRNSPIASMINAEGLPCAFALK